MNPPASQRPDDATLVAWLDGELPAAAAAVVARHVADDSGLTERVHLLRSSRTELAWALGESATAPPPSPLAAGRAPVRPRFGLWVLAAAALTIVVTVAYWRPEDRSHAVENDWLSVRLTTPRADWQLFSGIRFAIEGRAKTTTPCSIVAREKNETDAQMAARAVADNDGKPVVPMVLDAELIGPGQRLLGPVARVEGTFAQEQSSVAVELIDLRMKYDGISPLLTVRLDEHGVRKDFEWGFSRGVAPMDSGSFGFIPEQVGEYRLRLRLRALPTAAGDAPAAGHRPAFAEPLDIAVGFAVRGVVGEWSEPVDGMRARIVASRARTAPREQLAVAVQLRNDSDRARTFNVTGSTMAKIPQPFHFDLMVDGEQCRQRNRLGVITAARSSFLPQPVGTVRSVIVLADYWLVDDQSVSKLRGPRQVGMRFHFKPSLWKDGDKELWMGKIDAPPITIEFGAR